MSHYYTVTWVDNQGVNHTTSTADPNRLHSKVQEKYGESSGVTKIEYGDARDTEGPIYEAEPTPKIEPTPVVYTTPIMQQVLTRYPKLEEIIKEKLVVIPVSQPSKVSSRPLGVLQPGVMSPSAPKPLSTVYDTTYSDREKQVGLVHSNIQMVESYPVGTIFSLESGESISREDALVMLKQQEIDLVSGQQQIKSYESQGYVIKKDEQGNLVFSKPVTPISSTEEYQPSGWGFLSFLTSGFTPTFGLSGPTDPGENIKQLQNELMFTEQRRREMINQGDYLGLGWEVVTSPIPLTFITAGLGFLSEAFAQTRFGSRVFGEVTLPKILGNKNIVATPSTTFNIGVGGAMVGAGAGGLTKTFNEFGMDAFKQSLLVAAVTTPIYITAFKVGRSAYQNLPKEFVGQVYQPYDVAKQLQIVGEQRYIDVFGKKYYVGKLINAKGRIVTSVWEGGPPSWEPSTGIQPSSIFTVKPLGEPNVVPISWGGKTFIETGLSTGWQPLVNTKMIVKPVSSIIPFKPIEPVIKNGEIKWQPSTGLNVHPSEIKSLDELFKVYRENKITTEEYQFFREVIKPVETVSKTSPFVKSFVNVEKKLWSPPPIKMDINPEGIISTSWYGKKSISTGLGWQPKTINELSTMVYPKPKLFRAYETYYRFLVFEPKPFIEVTPKGVVTIKPSTKKTFTLKDIIKSDKEISKDLGEGQVQQGGTVTVQETETITKNIVDTLVVPEELQKPVTRYKTYGLQETETRPKNIFEEILQETPTKTTKTGIDILLLPFTSVKTRMEQKTNIVQVQQKISASLIGTIQVNQQKNINILGSFTDTISDVIYDTVFKRVNIKNDFYKTIENVVKPVIPVKPTEELPPPPKRHWLDISDDILEQLQTGEPVYHVKVKPRQYKDGERISSGVPYRITSHPLRYFDALAFGANTVDNTSKATIILEKTSGKPGKLPHNVKPWDSMIMEYEYKGDDRFVELNKYRIDSPGEIREISMRGWVSHKKKNHRRI